MRYSSRQLLRDQVEDGYDYGPGHRWVLIHTTGKDILAVEGGRLPISEDPKRTYMPLRIVAYPDDSQPDRQRTLATGRTSHAVWKKIAKEIFNFLGCEPFDVKHISRQHTLLLDIPGTADGPPVSMPSPKLPKLPTAVRHLLAAGTVSLDDDAASYIAAQPDATAQPETVLQPEPIPQPVVPQANANRASYEADNSVAKTLADRLIDAEQKLFAAADEYALIKVLWQREAGGS